MQGPTGIKAEVLRALSARLPEGSSAAGVARTLHLSVRTLQRKLASEGTTFREVMEAARGQLAQAYLSDPRVSIGEVAMLLGFSDASSFNRAFRRWTGESPGRCGAGRRAVGDPPRPPKRRRGGAVGSPPRRYRRVAAAPHRQRPTPTLKESVWTRAELSSTANLILDTSATAPIMAWEPGTISSSRSTTGDISREYDR
jgi:AraC-like DNA-binding protein